MPGNLPAGSASGDGSSLTGTENQGTGRGRKRYCKQCKFTCTDAREFTAHQTTHSESDDRAESVTIFSQVPKSLPKTLQTRRVLRPKRTSTGGICDSDTSVSAMEVSKDNMVETAAARDGKTVDFDTPGKDVLSFVSDTEKSEEKTVKSEQISETINCCKEVDEGCMEVYEGEDEPDAMSSSLEESMKVAHGGHGHGVHLPHDIADKFSADEEVEDEDRLIIADDSLVTDALSLGQQQRLYTCQHCHMTTGSAKSYLHHLKENHNTEVSIFECDLCDYATVYKQRLTKHRKLHFPTDSHDQLQPAVDPTDKSAVNKIDESNKFSKFSFPNSSTQCSPYKTEKTDDIDEEEEDDISLVEQKFTPVAITPENIDQVLDEDKKKKKKTRQEVDPGKYFEAVDSSGTKYACSQCGNIYKWRKSLNKHWKEKHSMDPLVEVASPPGMLELLKSGKYTQLGARRIYDKTFLATIKTNKSDNLSHITSPHVLTQSPSPPHFFSSAPGLMSSTSRMTSANSLLPKMIGPFVSSTAQPVFPGMPLALSHLSMHTNGYDSAEEAALDLTRDSKSSSRNSPYLGMSGQDQNKLYDQEQPLDFSKSNKAAESVAADKPWDDMKPAHSINQLIPRQHHCSKCDFTSTSEVEFANHTSSHLNKRIVRCFECKLQFNSMDELNNHFIKLHFRKLTDYKEAIKKIPHGLQQTYHLLNMEIQDIGELGNQDLGAAEGKSLKCKKCDFEAKWPAELQKHAVSHSEERPYICMVCGSTYKWKWDLVKHFQKSHPNLPNPYRRNDKKDSPDGSSDDEDEPMPKRVKLEPGSAMLNGHMFGRDDNISVEGIIAATQAGQRLISSQPNILDDEPSMDRNLCFLNPFSYTSAGEMTQVAQIVQAAQAAQEIDRRNKAQKAIQDAVRNRQNSNSSGSNSSITKKSVVSEPALSPSPGGSKSEELPYKCTMCNYHARWPSEVTQHMKNHSDSKPYLCPRCEYRSKWKWDVVKHLKRCGGGGINDVIDTTKGKKRDMPVSNGPPNVVVSQQGKVKKMTPQPSLPYILPSGNDDGQQVAAMVRSGQNSSCDESSCGDLSRPESSASIQDLSSTSNNDNNSMEYNNNNNNNHNINNNNNHINGQPFHHLNMQATVGAVPHMTSLSYSNSPTQSPGPQVTHTNSSRQSETWNCPHCPFTTQSQAELKRHSGLHSDDKPFKCDVCQYSTRWACDLKKHRKSYNHFPRTAVQKDDKEKTPQGRFKCTQCSIFFHTLQHLLEHRIAEHIGQESSHSSPAPSTEIEIDMARIKHPRKQVKKIECSKCEFVCKSRQTMDKHMDEHEQLEQTGIQCFYCRSVFKDKESLLDHITTHPAFNPKEWETFFMITDDDHNQLKDDGKAHAKKDVKLQQNNADKNEMSQSIAQPNKTFPENDKHATDSTEARIQQILSEVPKQMIVSQQGQGFNKFKCEWCPAEFVNLTAVYKHASQAHPIQLKEQDVGMALPGQGSHARLPSGQKLQSKKMYTGEPLDILKQQIADKRNHQLVDKYDAMVSSSMPQATSKKDDNERGAKRYNCDKCSFSSANLATFQRHQELHGSKLTSQCWFCDYSVDRMNLLYQHMKISHTRKWKALSQDPKYASQIHKMNLAFANASASGNNNDSPPDISSHADFSVMDLSSKNKTSHSEVTHDIMYVTKQQHTWSGIPVNIVPVGNVLNYVCPHCAFHNASIGETCEHVVRSHRAMSKFTCKTCQFCDDNIHVMSDHCKKEHPVPDRIVEVVDFKQINYSELQIVQLNALREQMAHNPSKTSDMNTDAKSLATKAMSCPFCPFKTLMTDHMHMHISRHSKPARFGCQFCDFSCDVPAAISEHIRVHDVNYIMDYRSLIENFKKPAHVKKEPVDRTIHELESKPAARVMEHSELTQCDQEGSPRSKTNKRIRYRCSECPYHTTCKSNMVKHVRQHNNNKKYKCTKCSYGAARAVLLKNHLDSHDAPTEDDGQHHDIFCDPSSPNETFKNAGNDDDSEETEMDAEDFDEDDEDPHSDDSDETNVKAIVDLEAKDILEAEAAHRASIYTDEGDSTDKQSRRQKCPHCPFSSNSGYEFCKHLNFHGTQERYRCDHCSYSLDRLNLLSQHRRLHADEPGFNPNPPAADLLNTDFIFLQNSEMADTEELSEFGNPEEGKTISAAASQFSCLYCPYKTTKKKLFGIHCNSHDLRKRFICDYCDWSSDRMVNLYQHRRVHEHEPTYNPNPEEKVFLNQEFDDGTSGEFEAKLMEIKNIDKPIEEGETETPPFKLTVVKKSYPCRLCPYKTNSKNSFSVHQSMHDSEAQFACSECSYASENKGLLKQHLHLHVSGSARASSLVPPSVRTQLNRKQTSDIDIPACQPETSSLVPKKKESPRTVTHLESQSAPQLKCQRCPFTASSQNVLKEHTRCHTAQDSLTCPFCDFSATSRQIMYPHIQIHFPGTKLEPDALECMLEEHTRMTNNNIHIHDNGSQGLSPTNDKTPSQAEKEAMKRVYVCQFCEREFEAKHLMIQHEKQHLVGSHAEDKCD